MSNGSAPLGILNVAITNQLYDKFKSFISFIGFQFEQVYIWISFIGFQSEQVYIWLYDNMKLTGGAISKKASQRPAPRNFMWCFSLEFQLRQQAPQQERQQKSLFQTVFAQAR